MAVLLGHGRGGELDQGDAEYPPPGQRAVFQILYVLYVPEVLTQFFTVTCFYKMGQEFLDR